MTQTIPTNFTNEDFLGKTFYYLAGTLAGPDAFHRAPTPFMFPVDGYYTWGIGPNGRWYAEGPHQDGEPK